MMFSPIVLSFYLHLHSSHDSEAFFPALIQILSVRFAVLCHEIRVDLLAAPPSYFSSLFSPLCHHISLLLFFLEAFCSFSPPLCLLYYIKYFKFKKHSGNRNIIWDTLS